MQARPDAISFKHLSVEDGLSQSTVWSIYQDTEGFMWFGTRDGLNKYDGYQFTVYKNDATNPYSLSNNNIRAIYEDDSGAFWIGTYGGGLNKFNRKNETFSHYRNEPGNRNSLSHDIIFSIYKGDSGVLWIGTYGGGLNRFNCEDEIFRHYKNDTNDPKSLISNRITSLYVDHSNTLWVGTNKGLDKFDKEKQQFFHYRLNTEMSENETENYIWSIYEDRSGILWIGTDKGLNQFDRENGASIHYQIYPNSPNSLSSNDVRFIYEDYSNTLWVGTFGGGISQFDRVTKTFKHYKNVPGQAKSLSDDLVLSMCQDQSGGFWVGTFDGGINQFDRFGKKFMHYKSNPDVSNSLSDNNVMSIFEDHLGDIWIGTFGGGLNRYNRHTKKFFHYASHPDSSHLLSGNNVTSIYEDTSGILWAGTISKGLNKFNRQTERFTHFQHRPNNPNSLSDNSILSVYESRDGNLWIGTLNGGLNQFDRESKKFKSYQHNPNDANSLSHNAVYSICEDSFGMLWIGTSGGGLNRFDPQTKKFINYKNDPSNTNSLSNNNIYSLYEKPTGVLWIGTAGGGLNKFDYQNKIFTHYREKAGLPNNVVYGILEDDQGFLWLSTNRGISKFNPNVANTSENLSFKNYDVIDGLQSSEFNVGAYHKSRSGEMFFGGVNGFNSFYPDRIKDNLYLPPIVFTDFQVFNQSVKIDGNNKPVLADTLGANKLLQLSTLQQADRVALSYKENVFSFGFAALNYISPEKNQYAYMMEGFDKNWVYIGNKREATYTNLDPGEYIFKVKGTNNDGIWNNKGTAIQIIITPPFWNTLWFRFLVAFVSLALGFIGYRARVRNIKTQKKKLEKLVMERTNELQVQKEFIEKQAEKLLELNRIKSRLFTNISHEFRTPLTLILGPLNELIFNNEYHKEKNTFLMMRENASRLLRLITQLLYLSKIEAGKMELSPSPGDIIAFIKRLILSFSSLSEHKQIILKFKTQYDRLKIYFDHDALEKIIYNLLSNAFKFTSPNGKITVEVTANAHSVIIGVSDTGKGIPADKLRSIFDRFYQGDDSRTREHEGIGIGLSLTKELVELCGGTIGVKSELGVGTEFVVSLPLKPDSVKIRNAIPLVVDVPQSVSYPASLIDFEKPQTNYDEIGEKEEIESDSEELPIVLIVEDNLEVQQYIRKILSKNYQIIVAAHGREGIQKAQQLIPDLIISDVMMPKMDGYELCHILKTNEITSHIPIILLTAKASDENKIKGLEIGADAYITKPFIPKELYIRIKNLIEQRQKLRKQFSREVGFQPHKIAVTSLDEAFLKKIHAIIEEYINDPTFSSTILRNKIGMSRTQFHRKLRALTGQAPGQLIRSTRLNRAMQLLEKRAGSVSEIAFEVGFNNLSYFSKCFREQFGQLPSEFEKTL